MARFAALRLYLLCFCAVCSSRADVSHAPVVSNKLLEQYVTAFNAADEELYANIPNAEALEFLEANIPRFECPDKAIEQTYYFRWWTFRKHIKQTPDGYVITEFLPDVSWARKHNTINCPVGHHYYEGRWLKNPQFLDDYSVLMLGICFFTLGENTPRGPHEEGKKGVGWTATASQGTRCGLAIIALWPMNGMRSASSWPCTTASTTG